MLATATAHSALAHSLGPRVQRAHQGGGHPWHSWKKLLAQLGKAAGTHVCSMHAPCMHDFYTQRTICTPRAQPNTHVPWKTISGAQRSQGMSRPRVLMSHPTLISHGCHAHGPFPGTQNEGPWGPCAVPVNVTHVGPGGGRTPLPQLPPGLVDPSVGLGQSLPWGDAVGQSGHRQGWGSRGADGTHSGRFIPIVPWAVPGAGGSCPSPRAWHVATSLPGSSS